MIRETLFIFFVILIEVACHDEQLDQERLSSKTIIKTGTVCGWCTINDTLTIIGNSTRYVNYTQCSNSNPAVDKKGQLKTSELEALLAQLDFSEFKKLELNSGNIAFDGCDDWIY